MQTAAMRWLTTVLLLLMRLETIVSQGWLPGLPEHLKFGPANLKVAFGDKIEMSCNITCLEHADQSDKLYLERQGNTGEKYLIPPEYLTKHGTNSLGMLIPNATSQDAGLYHCTLNVTSNIPITTAVTVTTLPLVDAIRPENIQCYVYNLMDYVHCSWCSQNNDVTTDVNYTAHLSPVEKNGSCVLDTATHCDCYICGSDAKPLPPGICEDPAGHVYPYHRYTLYFTVTNEVDTKTTALSLNVSDEIVLPAPVEELRVTQGNDSYSLFVHWTHPIVGLFLVYYLNCTPGCIYTQIKDSEKSTFTTVLKNLTAHTPYTISIRSRALNGTFWSQPAVVEGRTAEAAPLTGPTIHTGAFRVEPCDPPNLTCGLLELYLKAPELYLQQGVLTSYDVTLNGEKFSDISPTEFKIVMPIDDSVDNEIAVRAVNSAGVSPPRLIAIPAERKRPQEVGVVAETTQYGRGIHFMLNDYGSTMDSFTFFSCSADTEVTGVERKCSNKTSVHYLPGNTTSYRLTDPQPGQLYSIAGNYKGTSSGLTRSWICIHDYDGVPGKPEITVQADKPTMLTIRWIAARCTRDQGRGIVRDYQLSWSGVQQDSNVTLPADVSAHTLEGLPADSTYNVSVVARSRAGAGERSEYVTARTLSSDSTSLIYIIPIAVVVTAILILVVVVTCNKKKIKRRMGLYDYNPDQPEKLPDSGENNYGYDDIGEEATEKKLNEIRRERFDEYCYGSEISQNGSEISLNGSEISQNGSEISRNSEERKTGRVAEKVEEKSDCTSDEGNVSTRPTDLTGSCSSWTDHPYQTAIWCENEENSHPFGKKDDIIMSEGFDGFGEETTENKVKPPTNTSTSNQNTTDTISEYCYGNEVMIEPSGEENGTKAVSQTVGQQYDTVATIDSSETNGNTLNNLTEYCFGSEEFYMDTNLCVDEDVKVVTIESESEVQMTSHNCADNAPTMHSTYEPDDRPDLTYVGSQEHVMHPDVRVLPSVRSTEA